LFDRIVPTCVATEFDYFSQFFTNKGKPLNKSAPQQTDAPQVVSRSRNSVKIGGRKSS